MNGAIYTDEDLIEAVKRYAALLGETPSSVRWQIDKRHLSWLPSYRTLYDRFGGWNKAMEAAGLAPHPAPLPKRKEPTWRSGPFRLPWECPECGAAWDHQVGKASFSCILGHKWSVDK